MGNALEQEVMSVADYLHWEATQLERHDYWRGTVYAMTGGTLRHNLATLACSHALRQHLAGSPCKVFSSDVKVAVEASQHYFYPDLVVSCAPADLADPDAVCLRQPLLVLEVLSPATAAYDRGEKFISLQQLPSLLEYALLDALQTRLEVFRRNASDRFEHYVYSGAASEAELSSIGWRGPLSALLE